MSEYMEFLQSKAITAQTSGFDVAQESLNASLKPFQRLIVQWTLSRGRAAIFAGCGLGKAQPVSQRVLTPSGWKEIGTITVGDRVFGSDGKSHNVTGVFPQGVRDISRVVFSDGSSVLCDNDHLWKVYTQKQMWSGKDGNVVKTSELASQKLMHKGNQKKFFVPLVQPLSFEDCGELPIDPYTLGVLIGDGSLKNSTPVITTPDREIIDQLVLPGGCSVREKRCVERCPSYSIVGGKHDNSINPITDSLRTLGLSGLGSHEKFIPKPYLFASVTDRLSLVQGLMDTDGYCSGANLEFSTSSPQLSDDFVFLVRSLGGTATQSKEPAHYKKNGEMVECLPRHRTSMKMPCGMNPFRLQRKLEKYKPKQRMHPRKGIVSIAPAGRDECVCISVDAEDRLYVTEGVTLTHNTLMQLEWAHQVHQHTGGDVLILAPLAVAGQTREEGQKFGVGVHLCRNQDGVRPGVNVTNYEMMQHFNPDHFVGVVLDESSILKNFSGKMRNALTDAFAATPHRLCCTATPAPNDHVELGNHSEFLGIMPQANMLATWFVNDGYQAGKWRLKSHAVKDFWRWVSSWAVCLSSPADLGFDDSEYRLPPLRQHKHVVDVHHDMEASGMLVQVVTAPSATDINRELRATIKERVAKVAELVNADSSPWVVWCHLNEESRAAVAAIPGAVEITGSMPVAKKEQVLADFAHGKVRVLVSKSSMTGFGLNWQHCNKTAFLGVTYSFEEVYQSIRRFWRFGQTQPVDAHFVLSPQEAKVAARIEEKAAKHEEMEKQMAKDAASREMLEQFKKETAMDFTARKESGERWTIYNGDSVELIQDIPSNSMHFSIFSPPFSSLFVYSDSYRDMGNAKDDSEFYKHFAFLVPELYRIIRPGRCVAVHCSDLPMHKWKDGVMGIKDFSGDLVREFVNAGWIYTSRITIWKDPVVERGRTNKHGLLHKTAVTDCSKLCTGMPDYLLIFRKPWGEDDNAPAPKGAEGFLAETFAGSIEDYACFGEQHALRERYASEVKTSVDYWQRYASPVWFDIRQTRVLQSVKAEGDTRHVCPLQLDVVERAIQIWTVKGETVFTPFGGIGSELWGAVNNGRNAVGIELKPEYFDQAVKNLRQLEQETSRPNLLEMCA